MGRRGLSRRIRINLWNQPGHHLPEYLGLSLREIVALLNSPAAAEQLAVTPARQRAVLAERRSGLDRVLRAIEHAELRAQDTPEPEWLLYQTILKEYKCSKRLTGERSTTNRGPMKSSGPSGPP
jgi:hypothetical protein